MLRVPEAEFFCAGGDVGLIHDSSALAIVGCRGREIHLMELFEMRPEKGQPLKLSRVMAGFAEVLQRYSLHSFMADGWVREPAREHSDEHGVTIEAAPEGNAGKVAVYLATRDAMREGRLHLGVHLRLRAQLRAMQSKPMSGGRMQITAPRRSGHGDLVSALVLAVWQATNGAASQFVIPDDIDRPLGNVWAHDGHDDDEGGHVLWRSR